MGREKCNRHFRRQFLINGPNERDQLFIEAGAAAGRLGRVPPYLLYLAEWHIRSRRVTIQEILEERIAAFDFDVIHSLREGGITDQGENQIIEVSASFVDAHPDELLPVESPEACRT